MYIKKIKKDNIVYYILSVCDVKTCVWSNVFIKEKTALLLIEQGSVKLIEA